MDAGAGDFSDREQTRDGTAPPDVGAHTSHPIMCGGGDRNRRAGPVKTVSKASSVDGRKALGQERCAQPGGVEQNRLATLRGHLPGKNADNKSRELFGLAKGLASSYEEAIRTLRDSILLPSAERRPRTLLMTSASTTRDCRSSILLRLIRETSSRSSMSRTMCPS